AAVERAEQFLLHQLAPRSPGLALYVSARPEIFLAVPFPRRPTQEVVWDRDPLLTPLVALLDDYERVAVALLDKRQARLYTVYLGAIETSEQIESDVVGKHAPGDWPRRTRSTRIRDGRHPQRQGLTIAWSGMAQTGQKRRHEADVVRHVRRVAQSLSTLMREYPFDRLLLAGPEEAVVMLRDNLPRPLHARLAGTMPLSMEASDADLLNATTTAAERIERDVELATVRQLLDSAGGGSGVLGPEESLRAAREGRVDKLVVSGDGEEGADQREQAITDALNFAGRIEVVSGPASELLANHGGMGAFTRY
ncbi:MAG TPA: host attachment protein, partial [Dehalococcoidia bacterium]|nr:host attachment protein [Dehalococcoidia bacterium]